MTAVVLRAALTEDPIELAEHEALVAHEAAGAVVSFAGVIRDHDGGRAVTLLEYSAHPSAQRTLADIAAEVAGDAHGVRAIAVSHRVGTLRIGDAALVVRGDRGHQGGIRHLRPARRHRQGPATGVEAPVLRRRF